MIAKAILEMFTQLPGASRSTVQSSGQPFQAFSDSLIAATKSFSISNSASDGSGRAGRRQRPVSDDTTTPSEGIDGGAVVSSAVSQQTQGAGAVVNPFETRFSWSTVTGRRSTGLAGQLARNFASAGLAGSKSSISQTDSVPANTARPTAVQSKLTAVQKPAAQPVATQDSSAGLVVPNVQNDLSVQVTKIQSSVAQASNAQSSDGQARVFQPAEVQSGFTSAQMPLAESTTTHGISTGEAAHVTQEVSAPGLAGIQSNTAQARNVATSISQPAVVQSKFTAVETSLAGSARTQSDSIGLASQPTENVPAAGWSETEPGFTSTSTPQSADIELNSTQALTPIATPATTPNTSTVVTSQPTRNVPLAGWNDTDSSAVSTSAPPTSISQPAAAQSSFTAVKSPLVDSATTESTTTGSAAQVPQSVWTKLGGTESIAAQASITSTSYSQPAVLPSKLTPAQTPVANSARTQNPSTVLVSQPAWNVTAARLSETERGIAPAEMSQPTAVQSKFTGVQNSFADSATIESTASGLAGQLPQNISATELAGTQSIDAQASIASTRMPQPVVVESNVTPVQTPLAEPATTQGTSTVAENRPSRNVLAAGWDETEANFTSRTISQTSVPEPAVLQSTFAPAQIPLVKPEATQETSTGLAAQTTQIVPAAELTGTQSSIAATSIAQTSIVEPSIAAATVLQGTIDEVGHVQSSDASLSSVPSQSSSKQPAALVQEMTAPITASPKSGNADPGAVVTTVSQAVPATDFTGVQDSLPKAAQSALSGAVQSAVANDPVENNQVPVVRAALIASAKDVVASALKIDVTVQTNSQPVAADQTSAANTISVPGAIVDQLASLPLYDGSLGRIQTIVSSLKPVSAAKPQANASAADKGSSTDQAGLKKNAEPVSEAGSRSSSQDAASSGNQSQGGNTPQAQDAAPLPINFASHPAAVIAPEQNTANAASNHSSTSPAGTGGVAARTTDSSTAHASIALPQSQPVINTAKLIQSMGQSEMRVGMRSNEFGNISISTSTTRDVVSAQISLEHGELAKTLAAHLPEMQARLGGNQPADVRIDMNGSATGQGTGSFGGTQNDSASQSRSGRQQAGNMTQGQPGNVVAERQFSSVAAAVPTGYARLDIRV